MSIKLQKKRKNSFTLVQFKKMMGKNLIGVYSGIVMDKKVISVEVKKIKETIVNGSIKQIGMVGYVNDSGILYIFNGVEKLFVIASLSYSDIKKYKLDIEICVVQYPKLDKATIEKLL
jgi:hypothetical protein